MSFAPWLGLVLLALGMGIGWGSHLYLSRSDDSVPTVCPKLPEPTPAPACPTLTDVEPAEGEHLPVYTSEVTGEGVIEFKFYGPDGTQVTRKWITRIPLSAPAERETEAAEAPSTSEEQPKSEATREKPAAKAAKELDAPASNAKPALKAEPNSAAGSAKAPDQKPTAKSATSKPATNKGKFTVQTGAYKDRESAEAQVTKLERRGFDARIEKAVISGKGTWYRVRVGVGLAQADANTLASKIRKSAGLEASAVTQ